MIFNRYTIGVLVVLIPHGFLAAQDIITAAKDGNKARVQELLSAASPSLRNDALIWASWKGKEDVVDVLLSGGADPNVRGVEGGIVGKTALFLASHVGNAAMVKKLLEKGALLDKASDGQDTALMAAVWATYPDPGGDVKKYVATVQALVQAPDVGAVVNKLSNSDETALSIAVGSDKKKEFVYELLKIPGIDVNLPCNPARLECRENNLIAAIKHNDDPAVAIALLDKGARTDFRFEEKTAFDEATLKVGRVSDAGKKAEWEKLVQRLQDTKK